MGNASSPPIIPVVALTDLCPFSRRLVKKKTKEHPAWTLFQNRMATDKVHVSFNGSSFRLLLRRPLQFKITSQEILSPTKHSFLWPNSSKIGQRGPIFRGNSEQSDIQ